MNRSATILAFPTGRLTAQDKADLARWGAVSGLYGWRIGTDGGPLIETALDGREHVRVTLRALEDDAVYFVSRERGGWSVLDRRGTGATWPTLRDALESICPTVWRASAGIAGNPCATPGQLPA